LEASMSIDKLIFDFFLFSGVGWVIEVLYRSVRYKRPVNPGFLYGPYVPLYGAGATVLIMTHHFISGENILVRALVYLAVTTALEYLTGEALLLIFRKRYWDYSRNFMNLRGHICPSFSLAWAAASIVFELILYPISGFVAGHLTLAEIRTVNVAMAFAFMADFFYSSGLVYRAREAKVRYDDFVRERVRSIFGGFNRRRVMVPALDIARRRLVGIRNEIPDAGEVLRRYRSYRDDFVRRAGVLEWRKK